MKMKKRIAYVLSISLSLLFLGGCSIERGQSYQKYFWIGAPLYFYDTNPYTPHTIYNDEYFMVDQGTYYMEYDAWDGSGWYLYYTIEKDNGNIFDKGDDLYYEIDLFASGPELSIVQNTKSISKEIGNSAVKSARAQKEIANKGRSSGMIASPIIGKKELRHGNTIIKIEYGRINR